ncbi:MAG: hypothetical protein KAQ88_12295, partial [Hyphomicrobiaceae bacterium]|nr:hypothetical protein [Hyphomicrobiaceae bacterium]
ARHTPRYLAAFEWRYNRRFELRENLMRLARAAMMIAPRPRKILAAIRPKLADLPGYLPDYPGRSAFGHEPLLLLD